MQHDAIRADIINFWDWFQANESMYRDIIDAAVAVESMNEQVLQFGLFSWEIGEGRFKPYSLTLSPNGDRQRLLLSQKIVAASPDLPLWEFNYCKPPRQGWDFKFEAYDQFMIRQTYDASGWEYVLQRNEEDEIEIFVLPDDFFLLDPDDEMDAVDLVLTNLLGEENVIHHLDAFEIVGEFDEEFANLAEKLPLLPHHFERLLQPRS